MQGAQSRQRPGRAELAPGDFPERKWLEHFWEQVRIREGAGHCQGEGMAWSISLQ